MRVAYPSGTPGRIGGSRRERDEGDVNDSGTTRYRVVELIRRRYGAGEDAVW